MVVKNICGEVFCGELPNIARFFLRQISAILAVSTSLLAESNFNGTNNCEQYDRAVVRLPSSTRHTETSPQTTAREERDGARDLEVEEQDNAACRDIEIEHQDTATGHDADALVVQFSAIDRIMSGPEHWRFTYTFKRSIERSRFRD